MMPSPVETPRTATPEAAWPVRDTYHSFGNANSDVVVVLSQGGPLPGLVQEVEVLKELSPLNLERLHLLNPHQAQTIDPAAFMAADITFDEAKAADVESAAMLATLVDHFQAQGKVGLRRRDLLRRFHGPGVPCHAGQRHRGIFNCQWTPRHAACEYRMPHSGGHCPATGESNSLLKGMRTLLLHVPHGSARF